MIVEDNELNMKLFHDLLEAYGYRTVGTHDGFKVPDLARKHRPDLILKRLTLILSASGSTVDGGQMHADDRCVDHLHSSVLSAGERAHDLGPNARSSPANEAIVASGVWAGLLRQVAPWRSRSPAG